MTIRQQGYQHSAHERALSDNALLQALPDLINCYKSCIGIGTSTIPIPNSDSAISMGLRPRAIGLSIVGWVLSHKKIIRVRPVKATILPGRYNNCQLRDALQSCFYFWVLKLNTIAIWR